MCGWIETLITRNNQRHGALKDYATVSLLAMGGAYLTNWALNYLNYTTRIVFKSCRVLPVMAFRTIVVGQRYGPQQYCAGLLLVCGIALFTMGDAEGMPNFSGIGIGLISVALVRERVSPLPDSQRSRAPLESTPRPLDIPSGVRRLDSQPGGEAVLPHQAALLACRGHALPQHLCRR